MVEAKAARQAAKLSHYFACICSQIYDVKVLSGPTMAEIANPNRGIWLLAYMVIELGQGTKRILSR